ncbi:MAG TPA: glycosyltransferase [Pyrinomonadaceae bacterium]|nr:glycosyltransferase [Pyrinomonadaceae bacterium]
MKILYCIPDLGYGGAERQLSYLAAELSVMGHEVHVASRHGGPNLDRMKSAGVVWHCLGGTSNRDPFIFFRLVGLMRKLKPDVVQTILTPMDIMGGAAALLTRTRWVLRESSSAPLYAGRWRNSVRLALGRLADAIVSNSAGGYNYWRMASGERPLYVIPNAIPLDEIALADAGRAKGFAFDPAEKVVLYAGRMDSGKNVENLIAALAYLADEIPFAAIICGDGPRRRQVERMAAELGVAHRIFFTGYVENLWGLIKQADALVSLSRFEGCPNVVLEAMACGCPLVVSDIPAHREILDERSALFTDPDNPEDVAAALKATLVHDDMARGRARAARGRAAGRPVEATARLYEQLYLSLHGEACDLPQGARASDIEAA